MKALAAIVLLPLLSLVTFEFVCNGRNSGRCNVRPEIIP